MNRHWLAALLLTFAIPAAALAQTPGAGDEGAVRQRLADFNLAFTNHEATALAAFWTDDGDVVDTFGRTITGRQNIEQLLQDEFLKRLRDASMQMRVDSIRSVTPEIAVADWNGTVQNIHDGGGKSMSSAQFRATAVMVKRNGQWLFAAVRASNSTPHP